jgi:hypothetical protein
MTRRLRLFFGVVAFAAATAGASPVLYVGQANFLCCSDTMVFSLPLTSSSMPSGPLFFFPNTSAMTFDPAGNLFQASSFENLQTMTIANELYRSATPVAAPPGANVHIATMTSHINQLALTSTGDLWVASGTQLLLFRPPFIDVPLGNPGTPNQVINPPGATMITGVAFDSAGNVYAADAGTIYVYAPPYSGTPTMTTTQSGSFYLNIAISGGQLFVVNGQGPSPSGSIDVYTLPLTSSSSPAFRITNGVNIPATLTFDQDGNLYVGNGGPGSPFGAQNLAVYAPPFVASSAPVTLVSSWCALTNCTFPDALAVFPPPLSAAAVAAVPSATPTMLFMLAVALAAIGVLALRR